MKVLAPPCPAKKARIEIIPLIDIMFFLLASFMLVSLSMVRLQGMQMTLPSIRPAATQPNPPPEILIVQLHADGRLVYVEGAQRTTLSDREVLARLQARATEDRAAGKTTRVFLNADKQASHGRVIEMLDHVKALGITRVTFSLRPTSLLNPPE